MSNFRPSGISLPTVVKNLLIINGLCYLANVVLESRFNISLNELCGLYYPESHYFKPFQLVTHVFMHGSFMHLFFNMFSLWMFGSVLENYWGPKRFFIYYFVTALGAAFLHTGVNAYEVNKIKTEVAAYQSNPSYDAFISFQNKDIGLSENEGFQQFIQEWHMQKDNPMFIKNSLEIADAIVQRKMNVPTIGASGAVFGLLLAFGMLFPNTELIMLFFPIPVKAKYFVMIYGAMELFQGISNNPSDNVAHFAHLGGMLFGFILIKYWNKKRKDMFY